MRLKTLVRVVLAFALLLWLASCCPMPLFAATWYVDFDGGNDANAGTGTGAAWKHLRGDANVTPASVAAAATFAAGDTILFKGGVVYWGRIDFSYAGSSGSPITLKGNGWGSEKAILDGSVPVIGPWSVCATSATCFGNTHFANIYTATAPVGATFYHPFFQSEEFLSLAEDPNPDDPFYYMNHAEFHQIDPDSETQEITLTTITDPLVFDQADADFWDGAYVMVYQANNTIGVEAITGFNPATDTVTFAAVSSVGVDPETGNTQYAVAGHPILIDTPGEFAIHDGTIRGTITDDPQFTDDAGRDYSLADGSPLIAGGFLGEDVGSEPYAPTGGGATLTAADIWNYGNRSLTVDPSIYKNDLTGLSTHSPADVAALILFNPNWPIVTDIHGGVDLRTVAGQPVSVGIAPLSTTETQAVVVGSVADLPTVSEFEARTREAEDYATSATEGLTPTSFTLLAKGADLLNRTLPSEDYATSDSTGNATEAKQNDILAALGDTATSGSVAALQSSVNALPILSEILAGVVDGSVDVKTALKRILAVTANNSAVTIGDPNVLVYKNAAGTLPVVTHTVPASGASRTAGF